MAIVFSVVIKFVQSFYKNKKGPTGIHKIFMSMIMHIKVCKMTNGVKLAFEWIFFKII